MEAMTCEQYVLGELEHMAGEVVRLQDEVGRLEAQCQILREAAEAEAALRKAAREALFKEVARYAIGCGEGATLEDYRDAVTREWRADALGVGRQDLYAFLDEEYREAYDMAKAREVEAE
ncbi:hypothetical protein [Olsenella urininfantis]|uniref:hypothetical protein n=1 Tax=Olsenella urininfantis TaxID=1871033 RepID=UPI0009845B21|nr:hypothetical protein [Olsenella urininfantis]